ncbi:MAG TPA: GAF domain-containing protein [Cyclobacteriaceae bacterium]
MKKLLKLIFRSKNLIPVLLFCFAVLLIINSVLTFYNAKTIIENNTLKIETEDVKQRTSAIIGNVIHGADLSVRGFALTKNPQLADPIKLVLRDKDSIFNSIENLLVKQHYNIDSFRQMKASVEDYLSFSMDMIELARKDSMRQFVELLNEDRGYGVWKKYEAFSTPLLAFEKSLNDSADSKYLQALSRNRIIQMMMVLLGIPSIIYIVRKLKSEDSQRKQLLKTLNENNRKYIFDTGTSLSHNDWKDIVADSINNFQQANEFITKISRGDYTTQWVGLNESNKALNEVNLTGNLVAMRELLKQAKIEDERRNWSVTGLAKFAEIIRNQNDFQELGDAIISNIVKYTNSNQGGLFVLNDENKEDVHLRLLSCYAWDKKKYIDKFIYPGNGLVGQCWQEGNPIFMTQVPSDYVTITSGLGQATPRCIFIVPLKVNDTVYGVLELASFQHYLDYEQAFLVEVCEAIASSIANVKTADQTRHLLEQSQKQTEELRSLQEEMRQNIEEQKATQEEIQRKASELESQINAINNSSIASAEFDLNGTILTVNESFLKLMQYSLDEIQGKNHRIFVDTGHANSEEYQKLWKDIIAGITKPGAYERIRKDRSKIYISGNYSVISDGNGKPVRVLKLATDIMAGNQQLISLKNERKVIEAQSSNARVGYYTNN